MATFDPARLDQVNPIAVALFGYRSQAPGFDARSGEGARRFGGRFNPPRSFPVIYVCLTRECVVAELASQAVRQSVQVDDFLPRELWSLQASLDTVIDLTDPVALRSAGLGPADVVRPDHALTQQIGVAAHQRGVQAIKSPSATGVDAVLALFPQNLGASTIEIQLVEAWVSIEDLSG